MVLCKNRTIHPVMYGVESFLNPHFIFVLIFLFFCRWFTWIGRHTQATHELRHGAEVVHESYLRLDLRHYLADRLRVKQSALLLVPKSLDFQRLSPVYYCKILEIGLSGPCFADLDSALVTTTFCRKFDTS